MAENDDQITEKHADELFKEFREVSVTEFFRRNKAHLGYSGKMRSLTTIVHELVTNSLDACEESGILPEITISLKELAKEHYRFDCIDNGPGIPLKHVSDVFGKMLAGTKFHRKVQLRGQQGIGVAGVTMFSQMTTGRPIRIKTSTGQNKVYEIKLMVDVSRNRADVIDTKVYEQNWRGTDISGEVKGVGYNLSDRSPFEYVRRTAISNPHLKITFRDPEGRKTVFNRVSEKIPKPPKEMKPHPKGMDVDEFLNLAKKSSARRTNSFMMTSFSRVSSSKVKEIQGRVSFDLNKNPRKLSWAEAEEIVKAFNEMDFMAPPTEGLSPMGEEQIRKAVLSVLKPEFESVLTRNPSTHSGGIPFQIEVAIAHGGDAGRNIGEGVRPEIMRFANRAPLLFDAGGCAITQAVSSIDWKRYGIKDFENSPVTIFVNLVSVYVPYISAGKQSIADDEEIVREIRFALMEVGRKFQRFHSRKRRELEREARLNTLLKYSTELASAIATLTGKSAEKIQKSLEKLIRKKVKLDEIIENVEEEPELVEKLGEEDEG